MPAVHCPFWRLVLAITSVLHHLAITSVLHRLLCSHVRRASMSCRQQLGVTVAGEHSRCNLQDCNLLEIGSNHHLHFVPAVPRSGRAGGHPVGLCSRSGSTFVENGCCSTGEMQPVSGVSKRRMLEVCMYAAADWPYWKLHNLN